MGTPTDWYKNFEKNGECPGKRCMWTLHHMRYVSEHTDRFTVYARCPHNKTLATNHREAGLHFKVRQKLDFLPLLDWDTGLERFSDEPSRLGWDGKFIDTD